MLSIKKQEDLAEPKSKQRRRSNHKESQMSKEEIIKQVVKENNAPLEDFTTIEEIISIEEQLSVEDQQIIIDALNLIYNPIYTIWKQSQNDDGESSDKRDIIDDTKNIEDNETDKEEEIYEDEKNYKAEENCDYINNSHTIYNLHDGTSQLRLQDSLFQFIPDDINHKKRRQKCYIYCIAITLVNLPLCQHYFYEILNCIEDSINMKQLSNSPFYNLLKSFNFHPKDNNDDFLMFIQKYINSDEYNAELDDHDPINVLHNMIGQLQKTILDNHIDIDSNRLNHLFTIKWQFNNTEHSHYMITLSSNEITESSIMNSLKEMMNISSDDIQTDLTILEAYILTIQCFGNNFETIPFEFFMNNVQYKLITVIVHIGSCQSFNHFVTLFLHDDGYWWISDDDHFERIHEDEYDQFFSGNLYFVLNHTKKSYSSDEIKVIPYLFFYGIW